MPTFRHDAVRVRLIRFARTGESVRYAELARLLDIDMNQPYIGADVGCAAD